MHINVVVHRDLTARSGFYDLKKKPINYSYIPGTCNLILILDIQRNIVNVPTIFREDIKFL